MYIDFNKENNDEGPKFKVWDVGISKQKYFCKSSHSKLVWRSICN